MRNKLLSLIATATLALMLAGCGSSYRAPNPPPSQPGTSPPTAPPTYP